MQYAKLQLNMNSIKNESYFGWCTVTNRKQAKSKLALARLDITYLKKQLQMKIVYVML